MKWLTWIMTTVLTFVATLYATSMWPFMLLLIIWCLMHLLTVCRSFFWGTRLKVQAVHDGQASCQYTIQADTRLSIYDGILMITWENQLSGKQFKRQYSFAMAKNESYTFTVNESFGQCGKWRIIAASYKPLAFLPFQRATALNVHAEVVVWPEMFDVTVTHNVASMEAEMISLTQRLTTNNTTERLGLRPYRMGDSMKQIHWKLSAKQDELIVSEHIEDEQTTISFYIERPDNIRQYEALLTVLLSLLKGCQQVKTEALINIDEVTYNAQQLETIAYRLLSGETVQKPSSAYIAIVSEEHMTDAQVTLQLKADEAACLTQYDFTMANFPQKFATVHV